MPKIHPPAEPMPGRWRTARMCKPVLRRLRDLCVSWGVLRLRGYNDATALSVAQNGGISDCLNGMTRRMRGGAFEVASAALAFFWQKSCRCGNRRLRRLRIQFFPVAQYGHGRSTPKPTPPETSELLADAPTLNVACAPRLLA